MTSDLVKVTSPTVDEPAQSSPNVTEERLRAARRRLCIAGWWARVQKAAQNCRGVATGRLRRPMPISGRRAYTRARLWPVGSEVEQELEDRWWLGLRGRCGVGRRLRVQH